jgi:hypothetical protein
MIAVYDKINLTENLVALFSALGHSNSEFVSYFELISSPRRSTGRILRLISYGQRPGSKFGDQGDDHSGKRTKRTPLNDSKLLQAAGNLSCL